MKLASALALILLPAQLMAAGIPSDSDSTAAAAPGPVIYPTYGVHNGPQNSNCPSDALDCLQRRTEGQPSDPLYPQTWVSDWTMFSVSSGWEDNPPPYTNPPSTLSPDDYVVSHGTTYYDSTYNADSYPDSGAMMEFYKERCLPIFPIDNKFTCAFISLGQTAYFLTYEENRPEGMPPCCIFSPENHPPRRDFIKHLPYSEADSARVPGLQAYSLWVDGPPSQPKILFGYAFESEYTTDPQYEDGQQPYRHPHSFYFSGSNANPPDAPMVSQNYTNFSAAVPDPANTWDLVGKMCTGTLPYCDLF